jgi:hypothetical protein
MTHSINTRPGFRERLVFHHKMYCNDIFSRTFANTVRFVWPFEVRDTYVRSRTTGMYQFSSTFLERADDLRYFCMDAGFVNAHPEFRGDVPIVNSIPAQLTFEGDTTEWEYFYPDDEVVKQVEPSSCDGNLRRIMSREEL